MEIWKYAQERVENKSVVMRVKHSPKLHALRSALSSKGSAMSKGAAVGTMLLRLGVSAIPVAPIVNTLINTAQQAVEKHLRSHLHKKRLAGATTDEDKVKFDLKELSVDELDRYRWKLKEAIDQLNQKVSGIDAVYAVKQKESKPCDAWLELAEALAQAERRARILDTSAGALKASMEECLKWSSKQMDAINKFKTDLGSKFKAAINAEAAEADKLTKTMPPGSPQEFLQKRHLSCSNYCHVQGLEELDSAQWQAAKQKLADIAKLIADPIQMESFLTTSGDEYKTPGEGKQLSYT